MRMRVIHSEKCLCVCCMEEHEVKTVVVEEEMPFKNSIVSYEAEYMYCENANELYMDENQMQFNDIRMKDAYRKINNLMTSSEISGVRAKYGISQKDLCILLGWGEKTITRYESHQVQDKAHDSILRKIDNDPEWFLSLLEDAKESLTLNAYDRYYDAASGIYEDKRDEYLRNAIRARYAGFKNEGEYNGNTELSIDKTVDVIRYFAASKEVSYLYKVKMMKLMWYADALSYKRRGHAITGLVYQALPMGAVPIGHNMIIEMKDIPCEVVEIEENIAYHFKCEGTSEYSYLSAEDIKILDEVIDRLGSMSTKEIVDYMHGERAYMDTEPKELIKYSLTEMLSI